MVEPGNPSVITDDSHTFLHPSKSFYWCSKMHHLQVFHLLSEYSLQVSLEGQVMVALLDDNSATKERPS